MAHSRASGGLWRVIYPQPGHGSTFSGLLKKCMQRPWQRLGTLYADDKRNIDVEHNLY